METLLVFGMMALMLLGLISLSELIVRSLRSRNCKPVDYDPVVQAIGNGLSATESGDVTHLFSAISAHLLRFFEHFSHH
ncbi:MAG: hypothetical protein KME10_14075 [Plectolyngbya sp. WJT66-NPBG17]|jgi:hypothetical protein|nr:hypothetical protein [Plectolyngbya sp. WJT66-NPBG17]